MDEWARINENGEMSFSSQHPDVTRTPHAPAPWPKAGRSSAP